MNAAAKREQDQLVAEGSRVLMLQGVVEARVPGVEQHRNTHLAQLDGKDGAKKTATGPPLLGAGSTAGQPSDLSKAMIDAGSREWPSRVVRARGARRRRWPPSEASMVWRESIWSSGLRTGSGPGSCDYAFATGTAM